MDDDKVFVHPTATAGDVKHFLQGLTKIKHTECTLVGAQGQKIPYWVEVHACSKANPDPTETKVLVPTVDRLPDSIRTPCISSSLLSVSAMVARLHARIQTHGTIKQKCMACISNLGACQLLVPELSSRWDLD